MLWNRIKGGVEDLPTKIVIVIEKVFIGLCRVCACACRVCMYLGVLNKGVVMDACRERVGCV